MIKDKKVYPNQLGGVYECGDLDHRYKYYKMCGVLEGTCKDKEKCKDGLACGKLEASKTLVIPGFHEPENNYCQVDQCDKYVWNDKKVIECGKCKTGFELDDSKLCAAPA